MNKFKALYRNHDEPAVIQGSGGKFAHKLHATLTAVVPPVATVYAVWMACTSVVPVWQYFLLFVSYLLTTLAITVGYHRLLTHRAFRTFDSVKALMTVIACMAGQGPPVYWVSNHRRHHRFVDEEGDPHSPRVAVGRVLKTWEGFWHAHVGWTFGHDLSNSIVYCPDLLRDKTVRWAGRHYFLWVAIGLLLPGLVGLVIENSWEGFFQGVIWGGLVRMFVTNQLTNGINSAAHLWGYRRYSTNDCSRNNWFLGIFTLGEGWHNNHHADGRRAVFSRAWFEIDIGGIVILFLEKLGLATEVRLGESGGEHDAA